MKKLLIIFMLAPMSLFAQTKVKEPVKIDSLAMPIISVKDLEKFSVDLQSIPYKDYQKLTPDMVLSYLIAWKKK